MADWVSNDSSSCNAFTASVCNKVSIAYRFLSISKGNGSGSATMDSGCFSVQERSNTKTIVIPNEVMNLIVC